MKSKRNWKAVSEGRRLYADFVNSQCGVVVRESKVIRWLMGLLSKEGCRKIFTQVKEARGML